jgi:hypothetical protein
MGVVTQPDITTDPRTAGAYPSIARWILGSELETNILNALGPDERVVGYFETSDPMGALIVCERRGIWFTGRLGSRYESIERPFTILDGPYSTMNKVEIRAGERTFKAKTYKKDAAEALAAGLF